MSTQAKCNHLGLESIQLGERQEIKTTFWKACILPPIVIRQPTWRGGVARPRSDDPAASAETCRRLAGEEQPRPAGPGLCSQTSWVFLTWFCYLLLGQVSDCFPLLGYVTLLLIRVSTEFSFAPLITWRVSTPFYNT